MVIGGLSVLAVQFMRRSGGDRDFVVIRRGLLVFAMAALADNDAPFVRGSLKVEPYGFVVLLASLGYVAARRALERDQQLGEIQKELEVARRNSTLDSSGKVPPFGKLSRSSAVDSHDAGGRGLLRLHRGR